MESGTTFEPYYDEKPDLDSIQRRPHPTGISRRRVPWVTLLLALAFVSFGTYHFHAIRASSHRSVVSEASTIASTPVAAPKTEPTPFPWVIIPYTVTECVTANRSDIIRGTAPSKCFTLGHGDDVESIHWAPGPKENWKACYFEDGCSGKNVTVGRGGCVSPGFVGNKVKVIKYSDDC